MPKLFSILMLTLSLGMTVLNNHAEARASRPVNSDGVSSGGSYDFNAASSGDGNPFLGTTSTGRCNPSEESRLLARAASRGAGNTPGEGAVCYVGVKRIIADAFGKNLVCTRQFISGGSAKGAGGPLKSAGFVNVKSSNPDACHCPGTIRVYGGQRVSGITDSAGTIHGHIEVVGEDGAFYHFKRDTISGDKKFTNSRGQTGRPLTGCYVMPQGASKNANFARCQNSNTGKADGDSGGGDGYNYRGRGER